MGTSWSGGYLKVAVAFCLDLENSPTEVTSEQHWPLMFLHIGEAAVSLSPVNLVRPAESSIKSVNCCRGLARALWLKGDRWESGSCFGWKLSNQGTMGFWCSRSQLYLLCHCASLPFYALDQSGRPWVLGRAVLEGHQEKQSRVLGVWTSEPAVWLLCFWAWRIDQGVVCLNPVTFPWIAGVRTVSAVLCIAVWLRDT